MKEALTKKQSDIFNFIKSKILNEKIPPTIHDICDAFGFASTNAASQTIKALEKKGYIQRISKGSSRGIRIVGNEDNNITNEISDSNSKNINIIGKGNIENPMSVFLSSKGQINVDSKYFSTDKLLFAVIVEDSGMVREGIFEGDIGIVVHDENVPSGKLVAVLINDSVSLRRYIESNSKVTFESNAKGFHNQLFDKDDKSYKILGQVIGLIRKFSI